MQRCCERGAKFHRNLEDEEEAMTKKAIKELEVFEFRFTNILELFSIYFFFFNYFTLSFFSILFLPTTFTHTHTHDPRPLPTTHDPRHLATLHENPLEIFPYGDPPLPAGKLDKLTPPPPWKIRSLPWGGGEGVWIFSGTTH